MPSAITPFPSDRPSSATARTTAASAPAHWLACSACTNDGSIFRLSIGRLCRCFSDEEPEPKSSRLRPMPASRSLNLGNSVSAVVFEAWRQQGYAGGG